MQSGLGLLLWFGRFDMCFRVVDNRLPCGIVGFGGFWGFLVGGLGGFT